MDLSIHPPSFVLEELDSLELIDLDPREASDDMRSAIYRHRQALNSKPNAVHPVRHPFIEQHNLAELAKVNPERVEDGYALFSEESRDIPKKLEKKSFDFNGDYTLLGDLLADERSLFPELTSRPISGPGLVDIPAQASRIPHSFEANFAWLLQDSSKQHKLSVKEWSAVISGNQSTTVQELQKIVQDIQAGGMNAEMQKLDHEKEPEALNPEKIKRIVAQIYIDLAKFGGRTPPVVRIKPTPDSLLGIIQERFEDMELDELDALLDARDMPPPPRTDLKKQEMEFMYYDATGDFDDTAIDPFNAAFDDSHAESDKMRVEEIITEEKGIEEKGVEEKGVEEKGVDIGSKDDKGVELVVSEIMDVD